MTLPPEPSEHVDATLNLWRVFGIADTFPDAPEAGFSTQVGAGPHAEDLVTVTIGALPTGLTASLSDWRAQLPAILDTMLGGAQLSESDRLARYQADIANVRLNEFENPYPNWVTVQLTRPVQLAARPGAKISWSADPGEVVAALDQFEAEGNHYIDGVVARLIAPLEPTNLALQRYASPRALIIAPSRLPLARPTPIMTINDAGISVGRQAGYSASMWASATAALQKLPTGTQLGKVTKLGAQAFTAARAETDPLRRFVIAFAGLEALVTTAEKDARSALIAKIQTIDPTLAIEELFWPTTNNETVNRNLVFRFSAVASVYSPATAQADVAAFRALAKYRNEMFHGAGGNFDEGKSVECTELLRRYLGILAQAGL